MNADQPSQHALQVKRTAGTITPDELVQLRALDLASQHRHRAKVREKRNGN
jgi:hypothetical protein